MHWLSAKNRSEFMACPELVRLEYAQGKEGYEPTILIKGNTLLLKYVVLGATMQLAFARYQDRLVYALKVCDDGANGVILWSIVEREEELKCILSMANGESVVAFLFNEIAVNVSWNELLVSGESKRIHEVIQGTALGPFDEEKNKKYIFPMLEDLHALKYEESGWVALKIVVTSDWIPIVNHFITASGSPSPIDLFDQNEGNQQEQICVWLTDNLQPTGAYHSPQRPHKGSQRRELTDILLSHEFGSTLIESKTLSLLARDRLPSRIKLKQDVSRDIEKAFKQLRGGIRKLREGVEITSLAGDVLVVERKKPTHAVVLIPDLDLIDDSSKYGHEFITDFMKETGGFPHILDISELLRIIQATEMIAKRKVDTTSMMAFDFYLFERVKIALKKQSLLIEVLIRLDKN